MMVSQPSVTQLLTTLAAVSSQLGVGGQAIRGHVERLAAIFAGDDPEGAARELEQLIAVVAELAVGSRAGAPGLDLGELASGLWTFATYLRAPTRERQAEVDQLTATLAEAVPAPPLDAREIEGRLEELALDAARRLGLSGAALADAVARMTGEMRTAIRRLERQAEHEAARARTASEIERFVDAFIAAATPLAHAVAAIRAELLAGFARVDVPHMIAGRRAFSAWLLTRGKDPASHAAHLLTLVTAALGPATTVDLARSDAARRADFELELRLALDQILRGRGPAQA